MQKGRGHLKLVMHNEKYLAYIEKFLTTRQMLQWQVLGIQVFII
uniref:Uncharacterized protein n=1 Tax=Anguilla anguilla TaxID=7936 RepID=A0A0E9RSG9_ANGAN